MNILIAEDEKYTAEFLREMVENDPDFSVAAVLESIEEVVNYLSMNQQKLDLLFFDIQLVDGNSFEIFRHIDINVPVIFCTAFDEYTLQAIKNNGIDYILKPFKEEEIHAALGKYKKLRGKIQRRSLTHLALPDQQSTTYQERFLTQYREKSLLISTREIAVFSVENESLYLYTMESKRYPLFKTMEYIESVCDPRAFFRINRQMLINRRAIISFEPYKNRKVVLRLNIIFEDNPVVSRLKVSQFKNWLEKGE